MKVERSSLPMSQMYVIHVMRWGTMEKTMARVCGWVAEATRGCARSRGGGCCGVHRHGCPAITAEPVTLYMLPSGSSAHDVMIAAVEARSVEHVAVIVPEVESHMTKSCFC